MIEFNMRVKEVFARHWGDGSWVADVEFNLPPKLGPGFEPVARVRSGGPLKRPPDVGDWLWVRPAVVTGKAGNCKAEKRDVIDRDTGPSENCPECNGGVRADGLADCNRCGGPKGKDFALFGKLMWGLIERIGGDFCGEEWSEDVLPLAQQAGLCRWVIYDPAIHGDAIEAEPGTEIWYWGDEEDGAGRETGAPKADAEGADQAVRQAQAQREIGGPREFRYGYTVARLWNEFKRDRQLAAENPSAPGAPKGKEEGYD